MNLPIFLGGRSLPWSFRGSHQLEEWLRSCPWLGEGGVRTVTLPDERLFSVFEESVTELIRGVGHHGLPAIIHTVRLDCTSKTSILDAIGEELSLAERTMYAIQRELLERRTLNPLFFHILTPDAGNAITDALSEINDVLRMLSDSGRGVCFLLVVPASGLVTGELVYRYDEGGPLHLGVNTLLNSVPGIPPSWSTYQHIRIAWEGAGNLDYCYRLSRCAENIREGDDDAFEAMMNEAALAMDGFGSSMPDTWLSPEDSVERPIPWKARRSLLQRRSDTRAQDRHALICVPIAMELLRVCFIVEANTRCRIDGNLFTAPASDEASRAYALFLRLEQENDILYPKACPAFPNSPWEFASFGEVKSFYRGSSSQKEALTQLIRIRNILSHGHYVSWRTILSVQKNMEIVNSIKPV